MKTAWESGVRIYGTHCGLLRTARSHKTEGLGRIVFVLDFISASLSYLGRPPAISNTPNGLIIRGGAVVGFSVNQSRRFLMFLVPC